MEVCIPNSPDNPLNKALDRYQVISAYVALQPPRGQRGPLLAELAAKTWIGADGEPFQVSAETLRVWVRRYRLGGLEALQDKPRPCRGCQVLTEAQQALVCALKREVPERSVDRLIAIAEDTGLVTRGLLRRSTVHRVLQREGISALRGRVPDTQDLDRFEALAPNDLWQSDMLHGPWLPDPARPGKMRRAYLYTFLDDHSRLLLHGRFSFKGDSPALELVFRRSLQKYGIPTKVYYDNGKTYRSRHMRRIIAEIGIHGIAFTKAYRPMGHGKIEKLNRLIRTAFLAELRATDIKTLDQLNEAWVAWTDLHYNVKVHGETGQAPKERWRSAIDRIRWAEEEKIRRAFLWEETRTADKAGVFSLFGRRYQVGPELAKRRLQVHYDPEALEEVEVWYKQRFVERVRPFEAGPHRRLKPKAQDKIAQSDKTKKRVVGNWLGQLVEARRSQSLVEATAQQLAEQAQAERAAADQMIVDLFADRLDVGVFDEKAIRSFLHRYGPFDLAISDQVLSRIFKDHTNDLHVNVYLNAIRTTHNGDLS